MNNNHSIDKIAERVILIFIMAFSFILVYIALNRYFNFDEFNLTYISSFFLRGETLYNEKGISHFPLRALINGIHTFIFGKTSLQLLYGRITVLIFLFITVLFTFKIVTHFRDKLTSLGAVFLLMNSFVFIEKGIEIRNDVFNMAFCTVSVYYLLRFLKEEKKKHFYVSGLFGGLALASTQKSIMWLIGISLGLFLYYIFNQKYRRAFQRSISYIVMTFIPVVLIFAVLIIFFDNDPFHILKNTVLNKVSYLLPHEVVQSGLPFPHSRWDMWDNIIKHDFMLFIFLVPSLIYLILRFLKQRERLDYIIVFGWFITGFVFYLIMKRPFHQSFLPTMPSIAVIVSVFASSFSKEVSRRIKADFSMVYVVIIICITAYPVYSRARFCRQIHLHREAEMFQFSLNNERQLENASFCVQNLKEGDKVVCFTHQQLFYEPIFYFFKKNIQGLNLYQIPPDLFKKEVIKEECKVMIFDRRTKFLNPEILSVLRGMYVYSGTGDIFIPGCRIEKGKKETYEVFVPGEYRIINGPVRVDGDIVEDSVSLEKGRFEIESVNNISSVLMFEF